MFSNLETFRYYFNMFIVQVLPKLTYMFSKQFFTFIFGLIILSFVIKALKYMLSLNV